jgi:hypothetical protein
MCLEIFHGRLILYLGVRCVLSEHLLANLGRNHYVAYQEGLEQARGLEEKELDGF